MSATLQDIEHWLKEAEQKAATHLIVALDTFNYDNYPVYVSSEEKIDEEIERVQSQSMQKIDEVYNMSMDINKQLSEHRVWNV